MTLNLFKLFQFAKAVVIRKSGALLFWELVALSVVVVVLPQVVLVTEGVFVSVLSNNRPVHLLLIFKPYFLVVPAILVQVAVRRMALVDHFIGVLGQVLENSILVYHFRARIYLVSFLVKACLVPVVVELRKGPNLHVQMVGVCFGAFSIMGLVF